MAAFWYTLQGPGVTIARFHKPLNDSRLFHRNSQRPLCSHRRGCQPSRGPLAGRSRANGTPSPLTRSISASVLWPLRFSALACRRATASSSSARTAGSGPSPISPLWPSAPPMSRFIPRSPASRSPSRCATQAAASPSSPRASNSTSCNLSARKPRYSTSS